MTIIILAGVLGVLALIVLLFRRLRQISWQLTQLRVEHDSERILREIGIGAGSTTGSPHVRTAPVRRRQHLALYLGGGMSAALMKLRHLRRAPALVAGGTTAVALGTALMLVTIPGTTNEVPAPPPTGASPVSSGPAPRPSASGGHPSSPDDSRTGGVLPTPGQVTDMGGVLAMDSTSKAPSGTPESVGPRPSSGSPGEGSPPPPTTGAPLTPSAPAPTVTTTATPLLCVDARVLVQLALCVDR